jgi:hypothetical protein
MRMDTVQSQPIGDPAPRSGYGATVGAEFPAAVYESIIAGFAWMLLAAWLAFGGLVDTDLDLLVVTVLSVIFVMIPVIIHHSSVAHSPQQQPASLKSFLGSRVDIATGPLPAHEAWLQIALIPVALAVAATIIGAVYVWLS